MGEHDDGVPPGTERQYAGGTGSDPSPLGPGTTRRPGSPEQPGSPQQPGAPEQPGPPEQPEQPEHSNTPERSNPPEHSNPPESSDAARSGGVPASGTETTRSRRERIAYLIAVVGIVVAIVSLVRDFTDVTAEQVFRGAPDASISLADGATVPYCDDLGGTARLGGDERLWVAVRKLASRQPMYRLTPAEVHDDGTWSLHRPVGGPDDVDDRFEITLLVMTRDTSDFVAGLDAVVPSGEPAYLYTSALPPGTEGAPRITVRRDPSGVVDGC